MSHFYGNMQGGRGEVTRTGTKNSGMNAHIRGWNCGVEVEARWNDELQVNCFDVFRTTGSNGTGGRVLLTTFNEGS